MVWKKQLLYTEHHQQIGISHMVTELSGNCNFIGLSGICAIRCELLQRWGFEPWDLELRGGLPMPLGHRNATVWSSIASGYSFKELISVRFGVCCILLFFVRVSPAHGVLVLQTTDAFQYKKLLEIACHW